MTIAVRVKDGEYLSKNTKEAKSLKDRMLGLMFTERMEGFDGLHISPCNSIHTFFMHYNIDVIFIDKNYRVVKVKKNIRPWRMTGIYFGATSVLELNAGSVDLPLKKGDQLEFLNV